VIIGKLFKTGLLDTSKIFALAGQQVKAPQYVRSRIGANVEEWLNGNLCDGQSRIISGNVLTGKKIAPNGFVSFYDNMVTAIPEGNYYEMFGWIWPGFKKFSFSHSFASTFLPKFLQPNHALDTNTHGEERPFVVTGEFEKVFPFDIYPMQLIKACIVEDIDLMENLGIYEVDAEDFALCEFIDPSKTEIQNIIRKGLDLIRKETI
jgi:Na+-transporting NADH:ubiquinone oxidoreductase, subunit NqrA